MINYIDFAGAMRPHEVIDKLNLNKRPHLQWHVQGACAMMGDGLYEAMNSLATMIKNSAKRS